MPDTLRPQDALAEIPGATEPVLLSVMTASGVRFEWYEGTAVVQELCALIGGAGAPEPMVLPDQDHVVVRPDGTLALSSRGLQTAESASAQVIALVRLMASLVPTSQMPVKLRLTLLSAISDTAPLATAADLSSALVYFERPDRRAVMRGVYLRWHLGPLEPAPADAPLPRPPVPSTRRSRRVAIAVAALIVLLLGAPAAWWFSGRPAAALPGRISRAATDVASGAWKASKALAASGAATVQSLASRTKEAPPVESPAGQRAEKPRMGGSPAAARGPKPAEAVDPTPQLSANAAVPPSPQADLPPFKVIGLAGSILGQRPAADPALPSAPALQPESGRAAATASGSGVMAAPVYSIADLDVEPPVFIRPKVATVLPADEQKQNLCVVDVMISDDGEVESVKLVRPAQGARETMMLSAVKAWRFRPALKGTRPVRYLKRVWISLSPTGPADR